MLPPFPVVANRNGRITIGLSSDIRQKSGELPWPRQVGNYPGPNGHLVGIYHGPQTPANTAAGDHPRFLWKLITEYPSPTAARMILKIFFLHAQNATEARALKVSQRMGNSSE